MPRLFAGLELPEEVVDLIGDLEQPVPGARWIAMDDLHVTLRFFGQSLGVGFARPLDYPAEWRWILELGQRF